MARWATLIKIATVDLTGCRAELVDAGAFKSIYAGSVDWANDATAHVQVINRGVKGIAFGIMFKSTEQSALENILAHVATAEAALSTFVVEVSDGIYTVKANVVPDYSKGDWMTLGKYSEGWYEDVGMRFITISDAT